MKNFITKSVVAVVTFMIGVAVATVGFVFLSPNYSSHLSDKNNTPESVPAASAFEDKATSLDENQITEISLERKECFGDCPVYKVVLRKDGTAIYTGMKYVRRIGEYRGKSDDYYFATLARLIKSQGYFTLKNNYSSAWSDQDTVVTSVVNGSERKTIENYGNEAPIKLWGIDMAIDAVVERISWERVKISKS